MSLPDKSQYGKLSVAESLGLIASLLPLPAFVLWKALTMSYDPVNRERSLKQIASDATLRYITGLSVPQLQAAVGSDEKIYKDWAKANKVPVTADELGEDARLYWIGPKRTERVLLFLHGGVFLLPVSAPSLSFWRYVQLEVEKQGTEVGFAFLSYTLAPYATFPTPLKQAALAVNFLLDAGVQPANLQLAGDSAGGNLCLQTLSHILHPLPNVAPITLSAPIRGMFLISPWTSLSSTSPSHKENEAYDIFTPKTLGHWGSIILKDVPQEHITFMEAVRASEGWFSGADKIVERVLVSAGGAELLRDDVVEFAESFKKQHKETELVVQRGGLHEDMFLDFYVGKGKKIGSLTPLIVSWVAGGFPTT